MSRIDAHKILEQVKENTRRLSGCDVPHDFVPLPSKKALPRYRCLKCGGEIGSIERHWYERGLAHAAGNKK